MSSAPNAQPDPEAPRQNMGSESRLAAAARKLLLKFPPSRATEIALPPAVCQEAAAREAAFGRVAIDGRGMTTGMNLALLEPVRALLADWRHQRSEFDTLLVPHMKDLEAVDRLDADIADLGMRRDREIDDRKARAHADTRFQQTERRFHDAQSRFNQKSSENNNRMAVVWGGSWSYWLVIFLIGVVEWQINYETFFKFFGVTAMAAGTTIIMGICLSFAAHGHGTIVKQWSHRFGDHREPKEKYGAARMLSLATAALILVLVAAGGSRYSAALEAMGIRDTGNPLDHTSAVDPMRDVLLSLLANAAAWIVGVFIAYFAHDQDDEFMDATQEYNVAREIYNKASSKLGKQVETIRARYSKLIAEKETAAKTQTRGVEPERRLLLQVREHEDSIVSAICSSLLGSAESYRGQLVQIALRQEASPVSITKPDGSAIAPYEYQSARLLIDPAFVRGMMP